MIHLIILEKGASAICGTEPSDSERLSLYIDEVSCINCICKYRGEADKQPPSKEIDIVITVPEPEMKAPEPAPTLVMKPASRIYVAGHRGMVGSAIVRLLSSQGFENIITTNIDLRDQAAVNQFFYESSPEFVFMIAGKVGGIKANNSLRADFIYDNSIMACNVIHAAYRYGVTKLLFTGSSCIYPKNAEQPVTEEQLLAGALEPTNEPYAIAKIAGIKLCQSYRAQHGCNFISVMPTNSYGPNDKYDLEKCHVLPALLRKFITAKLTGADSVELLGTGEPRREFLHVDDMADAIVFLMQHYNDDQIINIGTGDDVTIHGLAYYVKEIVGYTGSVNYTGELDGIRRKMLDVSKINALGWKAKIGLQEGIRRTVQEIYSECLDQRWLTDLLPPAPVSADTLRIDIVANMKVNEDNPERVKALLSSLASLGYLKQHCRVILLMRGASQKLYDRTVATLNAAGLDHSVFTAPFAMHYGQNYMELLKYSTAPYVMNFIEDHFSVMHTPEAMQGLLGSMKKNSVDICKATFFRIEQNSIKGITPISNDEYGFVFDNTPENHIKYQQHYGSRFYIGVNFITSREFALRFWNRNLGERPHEYEVGPYTPEWQHRVMIPNQEVLCAIDDPHGETDSHLLGRPTEKRFWDTYNAVK